MKTNYINPKIGVFLCHCGNNMVDSTGISGEGSNFRFTLPITSDIDFEKRFKEIDVFWDREK